MYCPNCGKKCKNTDKACPSCDTVFASPEQLSQMAVIRNNLSDLEANMVISLLSSYKIPAYKTSHRGSALNVYLGISQYGINVIVPQEHLKDADNILNATPVQPSDNDWLKKENQDIDKDDISENN